MKRSLLALVLAAWLSPSAFAVKTGDAAPDFKVSDMAGNTQTLSGQKGKFVVLEWHNLGCPFVRKHYETKNMQRLQKELAGKDLTWFTVLSSAKGKQGYMTGDEAKAYFKKMEAAPTAVLLDPEGKVGQAYEARTTPHMYVVNPQGKLIYQGAIDDNDSTDHAAVKTAKNYVVTAVQEARSGKAVTNATTEPYGCSVKYATR
jgi:peroxiredoxin